MIPKKGLILKKIIKFFILFKRRIDILNAEAELKFILEIILLFLPKDGLILKKIIKFFKLLKWRIDILNAESELKFILENE